MERLNSSTRGRGLWGQHGGVRTMLVLLSSLAIGMATAGCEQPQRDPAGQAPLAPSTQLSAVANNVDITLSAGRIVAPEILSSGWTNFLIRNDDRVAHRFGITGEGVDRLLPTEVQPGQTQQMRVELNPGTYRIYVPTGGPGMEGVSQQIVVAKW